MAKSNFNINMLLIDSDKQSINNINELIKSFDIDINLYHQNSLSDDSIQYNKIAEIIADNKIDYILISDNFGSSDIIENFLTYIETNINLNNNKFVIIAKSLNKKLRKHGSIINNFIVVDDFTKDIVKSLISHAILNKEDFLKNTTKMDDLYQDNFITTHDSLTMLPNRVYLMNKIDTAIIDAKINNYVMAIFFLDLDGFKNINDKAGHKTGDLILKEVAHRLTSNTRISDITSRHGGDEFIVFLPHIRNKDDVEIVANKLLEVLSEPIYINDESWNITASIGVSMYPDDAVTTEKLIEHADAAMYAAKKDGKNTISYFNEDINLELKKKYNVISEVRQAIVNNNFDIVMQPQHVLATGDVMGVEIFIRWLHPSKGIIYPNEFLPYLINTSYINSLGDLIVKKALALYYKINNECYKKIKIAINVEARQLVNDDFVKRIIGLRSYGINTESITIEVTEDCFKNNFKIVKSRLEKLKKLGVTICLDNFGIGNSSVTELIQLPIDIIKIDNKLFYKDKDNNVVKQSLITLAHSLNIKVMAKRIDDKKQLDNLIQLGCDYGQGFCYENPMSFDNFIAYVKKINALE